jgi:hypothetical protein
MRWLSGAILAASCGAATPRPLPTTRPDLPELPDAGAPPDAFVGPIVVGAGSPFANGVPGDVPPRADIGEPTVDGGADRMALRRRIMPQLDRIEFCYAEANFARPTLAGSMVVRMTLDGGVVTDADITTSLAADVDACVIGALRSIGEVPELTGVVHATVPITFHPPVHGSVN